MWLEMGEKTREHEKGDKERDKKEPKMGIMNSPNGAPAFYFRPFFSPFLTLPPSWKKGGKEEHKGEERGNREQPFYHHIFYTCGNLHCFIRS